MAVSNGAGDGPTDLDKKIIRQIEYYFGDMNLPRDKFLQEKIKEEDGWVTLDVMLNFNRLKSISDDKELIAKALRKSTSGLIEVSEDSTKIRRCQDKPLPDNTKERKDDVTARSVYVKGFPKDSSLDKLQVFFEQFGSIDTIFMRRVDKTFKGSVFVTFSSLDAAKAFVEKEDIKPPGDSELIKMFKEDYFKKKSDEQKQRKKKHTAPGEQEKAEKKKEDAEKKLDDQMTRGAVLFMKGLPQETTMEEVKEFFGKFGSVAWVEYANGDEKALVRFQEAEAESALEKAKAAGEGKVVMKEAELETRILEGEEEKEYWRKMFSDIADKIQKNKSKRFQKGKRKFGGRHSHKHGNKDDDDVSPAKKAKVSDGD